MTRSFFFSENFSPRGQIARFGWKPAAFRRGILAGGHRFKTVSLALLEYKAFFSRLCGKAFCFGSFHNHSFKGSCFDFHPVQAVLIDARKTITQRKPSRSIQPRVRNDSPKPFARHSIA